VPDLDVTDILTDPDLADCFTVIRRENTIGNDGVGTVTPTSYCNVVGVVTAAGNQALQRLPESQLMGKTVSVVTTFRLRGATTDPVTGLQYQPDLVVWPIQNGTTFVVADLQDWSRFGAGFVEATCSSIGWSDPPPQGFPP
jgi:hypothetical protein